MTYLKYFALISSIAMAFTAPLTAFSEDFKVIFSEEAQAELNTPANGDIDGVEMHDPFLFLEPYEALLQKHLQPIERNGIKTVGVDYPAWKADSNHKKAMNALQYSNTHDLNTREKKIAFWINAFNLMVIDLIVTNNEVSSIQNLGGLVGDPWNEYSWDIGESNYTLQFVSDQIIAEFMEARAYFAISRAAIGTPPLRDTPYLADGIYSQLEEQTQKFIDNKNHAFNIERTEKTRIKRKDRLYISRVFEWHKSSIRGGDIMQYLNRYYVAPSNAAFDGYMPFDWTLNSIATPPVNDLNLLIDN